jgi:hypothetical protein
VPEIVQPRTMPVRELTDAHAIYYLGTKYPH